MPMSVNPDREKLMDPHQPEQDREFQEQQLIPSEEGNNAHVYTGMEREKDDKEICGPG